MLEPNQQEQLEYYKKYKENKGFLKGLLVGIITTLLVVMIAGAIVHSDDILRNSDDKMQKVKRLLDDKYLYENKGKEYSDDDIKAYVQGLGDPYTEYYTREEMRALRNLTEGRFFGIGVKFAQDGNKTIEVKYVFPESPAESAGLLVGDILKKVNGIDVSDKELSDVVGNIKGEENTFVEVEFFRPATNETISKRIERKEIKVATVEGKLVKEGIGYIKISEFTTDTANQYDKVLKRLESVGAKSLVIDLRDNPGGVISDTTEILDTILPKGIIVSTVDKYESENTWTSDEQRQYKGKIVVLINGNSASASEIFTGALMDYKKAVVVGEKSFGKGVVQQIVELGDGSGLKVTTSEYFTPNKRRINKIGIEPDIVIKNDGNEDKQLEKAIEILEK